MDMSSSSKVTVEYEDPAGLFSLLKPDLDSRLPLRNLNWKSAARPLRNIDALRVEFVPSLSNKRDDSVDPPGLKRTPSTASSRGPSTDSRLRPTLHRSASHPVGQNVPQRERRHQIPGLSQTPYLRLFLLRCDDKDSYKAEHRQQLRDWVSGISPQTQSTPSLGRASNHDAFEWMIIHVVIPDTKAASEPRWTAAKKDPDELAERSKTKAKWATKSNTTVFDKLRSDFPPAVKSGLERVAQIRLARDAVPESFLPATAVPAEFTETAQERSNAWQDLVAKFKTSILRSFDRRVTQYEDDVREKEAQRALPGWNFCTFFTLKENLAMAFESVGLVEDALAIYDELEAGLDFTISKNNAILGDMAQQRNQLVRFANPVNGESGEQTQNDPPISPLKSPSNMDQHVFRRHIVSSTISLFDFHTYIFTRQRLLVYRLGEFEPLDSASTSSAKAPASAEKQLVHVAEVCRRTVSYISSNTRTLREELRATTETPHEQHYNELVQSLAASWAYTTSTKLLDETAIPLGSIKNANPQANGTTGHLTEAGRRSALVALSSAASPRGSAVVHEHGSVTSPTEASGVKTGTPGSGPSELAASRLELCLLQRRSLETMATLRGWQSGWNTHDLIKTNANNDQELPKPQGEESNGISAVLDSTLDADGKNVLTTAKMFRERYSVLTSVAIRYAILGNRLSAAENLFGDLALSKYQDGDCTGAAQIFSKLVPKYMTNRWSSIEVKILQVYADCLRRLNRRDEYIRTTLCLLRKYATMGMDLPSNTGRQTNDHATPKLEQVAASFSELVDFSLQAQRPYRAPLEELFVDLDFDRHIQHLEDEDGFGVYVGLSSLLNEEIVVDRIKLRLVNARDPSQEILLESSKPLRVSACTLRALVATHASAWGLFNVRQITTELGNMHFTHEFEPTQKPLSATITGTSTAKSGDTAGVQLLLYQRWKSLDVQISAYPDVHVDKPRSFEIRLHTGSIEYDNITLRFKPATAGLRLQIAKLEAIEPDLNLSINGHSVNVQTKPNETINLKLPYSLDVSQLDLTVKVEVACSKGEEVFTFFFEEEVAVDLHLDVDVNDTFKPESLFSQFSVRTTSDDPLLVESIAASGSEVYSVTPQDFNTSQPVFDKQSVCLTCRIDRTVARTSSETRTTTNSLEMKVDYFPWATVVSNRIRDIFEKDLADSNYSSFHRLLVPVMTRSLIDTISSKALEDSLLLGEAEIPSFAAIGWDKYLAVLPGDSQSQLREWLHSWHSSHQRAALNSDTVPENEMRSITVPVDIPTVQVLASASFTIDSDIKASRSLPPIAFVGEPLSVKLNISVTHHWSADPSSHHPETRLIYNIPESPDWIIAGTSSATFVATDANPTSFPLLLIPLVPGALFFPHVEVQLAASKDSAAAPEAHAKGRYACETDFESAAETVLVLRPPGDADYSVHDPVTTPHLGGPVVGLGVKLGHPSIDETQERAITDEHN